MAPPDSNALILQRLTGISDQMAQVLDLLWGERRGVAGARPPGLIQDVEGLKGRITALEDEIEDLGVEVIALKREIADMRAAPGRVALSWWERIAAGVLVAAAIGVSGAVGANLLRPLPAPIPAVAPGRHS